MSNSGYKDKLDYSTIIVITPKDFPRLVNHNKRLVVGIIPVAHCGVCDQTCPCQEDQDQY